MNSAGMGRVRPITTIVLIAAFAGLMVSACKQRRPAGARLANVTQGTDPKSYGVHFVGCPNNLSIRKDMSELFEQVGLTGKVEEHVEANEVWYGIPQRNTLEISSKPEWNAPSDDLTFKYQWREKWVEEVRTMSAEHPLVSQKEILIALLMQGRSLLLDAEHCHVGALIEHVQVRQSIAKIAQVSAFTFPQGRGAEFVKEFWKSNITVRDKVKPSDALFDTAFTRGYEMGCTAACKTMVSTGIYSYYRWGNPVDDDEHSEISVNSVAIDELPAVKAARQMAITALEKDKDPLAKITPQEEVDGLMASKTLMRAQHVPWDNWIAGDWGYILNGDLYTADPKGNIWKNETEKLTSEDMDVARFEFQGLEGTNIIYLGRGVFAQYYWEGHSKPDDISLDQFLMRDYVWRWEYGDRVGRDFKKNNPGMEKPDMNILRRSPVGTESPCTGYKQNPKTGLFDIVRGSPEEEKKLRLHPTPCGMVAEERDGPRVLGSYAKAIAEQVKAEKAGQAAKPKSLKTVPENSEGEVVAMTVQPGGAADIKKTNEPKESAADAPISASAGQKQREQQAAAMRGRYLHRFYLKLNGANSGVAWAQLGMPGQAKQINACVAAFQQKFKSDSSISLPCRAERSLTGRAYRPMFVCSVSEADSFVDKDLSSVSCLDAEVSKSEAIEATETSVDRFLGGAALPDPKLEK